jgi:hypothetical protein
MRFGFALGISLLASASACSTSPSPTTITAATKFAFTVFDGPGGSPTTVNGINNHGEAVGFTTAKNAAGDEVNSNFVRHADGTFTALALPDPGGSANAINSAGQVVGVANDTAFLLAKVTGQPAVLSPFSAPKSVAFGINDDGVIVGQYDKSATVAAGFVDVAGAFTDISPTAAAVMTFASGTTAAGLVAGFYSEDGTTQHGFTFDTHAKQVTLVTDPSTARTKASPIVLNQLLSINANRQVSGYYQTTDGSQYGLIYDVATKAYVFLDAPAAAPVGGVQITQITGITDANELAGFFIDSAGAQHGFIATPMK